jgi:predicted membrane protein
MDEQDVKQETGGRRRGRSGRVWAGLLLLLVGGVLLLDQMNFPLPDWLFNWHALLIVVGLFLGLRHGFRGGAWLILMAVGGFFMLQDVYPDNHIHRFFWPCILIVVGLVVMLRPRNRWHEEWQDEWQQRRMKWHYRGGVGNIPGVGNTTQAFGNEKQAYSSEDFIDSTSIFGGVHRKVVSKNFRGGDITTLMGGTELDFTQADFTGTIHLDITTIMGGCKIIVPAGWEVRSHVTAVFAGFEDKRQQPIVVNPDKVLIIEGASIFGGIELKNF